MNRLLKAKIRCKKYRKKILEISQSVTALHIGGSFSSVEIVDCIYNRLKKNHLDVLRRQGSSAKLESDDYKTILSEFNAFFEMCHTRHL